MRNHRFPSAVIAIALLVAPIQLGCGSTGTQETSSQGAGSYLRELGRAVAPLAGSRAQRVVNRTTAAGEYRRAAVALETFLPELEAYGSRLEEIDPPAGCIGTHRKLERLVRASVQVFEGAVPVYRRDDPALVEAYMQRADALLKPISQPVEALDGLDRLPCEA